MLRQKKKYELPPPLLSIYFKSAAILNGIAALLYSTNYRIICAFVIKQTRFYIFHQKADKQEREAVNVDEFLSVVRRYTEIEKLNPAIVHEFIDRIIIYEPEQARGNRRQKVEIIYNKIGAVDLESWQDASA